MASLNGDCPAPFLQESLFPTIGGFVDGRYCEDISFGNNTYSCCLPCPLAEWRYDADLDKKIDVASWISVAILPLCIFLLASYAVLPVKWTHRHYLSICFTLGICCMEIAFIIPLGAKPQQCYNAITPNDMHSDLSCAFSGSFLLFGGWMVVMWSFIRTIAFHLQVCWEVVLGPKFMWGAFVCGFGIPAIGLTVMLILTGVSFRFGEICHINVTHALQDYWIPIMVFAAAALFFQLSTMGYCTHIYLRSLFDRSASTTNSSGLPSYDASVRTVTARQAYRRIRRILQLQWRGVALVLIIIANVIYFAVVFIELDNATAPTAQNVEDATPWLLCLVETRGDRVACRSEAAAIGPNEATILAVVFLLSLVGFWNFILFARPSMFAGWLDLFKRTSRRNEFVSADAHTRFVDNKGFEMLTTSVKSPDTFMRSPSPVEHQDRARSPIASPSPAFDRRAHFGQEARYIRPSMSFSGPRPPESPTTVREWDPQATFAPGYTRD
ncbi:hypothetical protein N7499_002275 [Penicillium canescens]|uniref:G-protein coupled receptors family 2 profile 2 domain-containing protein n=1 Tax=Penicillium canescens TaxID=5083 RepID=A0AAD6I7V8_PENCN|nr:uncharacterized protein N7446_009818 [Penicillium canescens]KAJ6001858.1 hypothetical protein N7522_007085 [Penicillium canescens]KAJ6035058.1 hypothetical protein N7460_009233 [Penicillium canescens]KAJ6046720.1 hypothetical protein N7444_007974 [Penicillium canescens]KAJ6053806.1 hypothetical protein N7446_009818 [Penicillium canescens]KAJ6097901.1 hypothetical protein N7499_002275 [Penicillium canescens]